VAFEEVLVYSPKSEALLKESPIGKVPFLRTEHGSLSESQTLVEYIEDRYPDQPLFPQDAFARARCREMIEHLELHLELPARRLYYEALFGGKVSDATKAEVETDLKKGLRSLAHLSNFSGFVVGDFFTHADCAAWVHLPLVRQTAKRIYGRDLLADAIPASLEYLQRIGARPHAVRVAADREAGMAAFFAAMKIKT
jgi:glutathione S-transferase